jgi:hypothetical protein
MRRPPPGRQSQCEGLTTEEEESFPMDTQNPSAQPCAESRTPRKNHPHAGGLTHDNTRHTTRFTVIGNHLAQHRELSLLAIGLAVHLQSPPSGVRVDIKTLTARFPEGATRIAAALRELEKHGYLRRERKRIPDGRIVTRTVSCNQPGRRGSAPEPSRPPARRPTPRSHPSRRTAPPPHPGTPHTSSGTATAATAPFARPSRADAATADGSPRTTETHH